MSRREKWVVGALAAGAVLVPMDVFAQGCAMCATYLNGTDPESIGFKWSILLLLCAPYLLLTSVGGWLAFTYWRSRRDHEQPQVFHFPTAEKEGIQ